MDKVKKGPNGSDGIASQEDQRLLLISVGWMGTVADSNTKTFLLGLTKDASTDANLKSQAISSYLIAADAEETKNALLRFLVEGDRMDCQERSSICAYAKMVFKDANPEKKEAIRLSLFVALSKEDNKWLFRVYDDILCKISKDYANSHERLALLKRLINVPSLCKVDDYAMPELQEKLKALQKIRLSTNISTNLSALNARNFNLPQPDLSTNEVTTLDTNEAAAKPNTVGTTRRSIGMYAISGLSVFLLLSFGAWKLTRK
jgi:hypothetical protein